MMRRQAIAMTAFVMLAAACGQYPGVHEAAVQSGQFVAGPAGTGIAAPGTDAAGGGTGTAGTTTGGGGIAGTTGTTTGTTTGGTTEEGGGKGGGQTTAGGDATGVTATSIKIGVHAPLTGAAPLKAESFDKGKDLYWLKGNNGKPVEIYGRKIQVVFQDDQYNPSHARAVCQQMAEQQQVFALFGGGGTDQIQACAQYAASKGIPYLSAGVTEIGLSNLSNYFALSMTYADQAPLLAQYIKANASALGCGSDGCTVAMVATNTPNFDDAVSAFTQSYGGVKVFRPDKNERGSTMAGNLCTAVSKNYEVVFPLTAPTYFLEMAGAAQCRPKYVGVGVTMGLDTVASTGCRAGQSTADARFFSPAPAFADSNQFDPQFRAAGGTDDIMWLLWASAKVLHQLFLKAGENLTREGFVQAVEKSSIKTGIFPDLNFSPSDHFGANQVHVLRVDCSRGAYVTEKAFAGSF
jgi:ABC-type branched-subunit amino acid transport system substrate-binding protein